MGEWKEKLNQQDEDLDEITKLVRGMKDVAITLGDNINLMGEKTKKVGDKMDKANEKTKTKNGRLKDLINKIK